jgi:hypothetical protein
VMRACAMRRGSVKLKAISFLLILLRIGIARLPGNWRVLLGIKVFEQWWCGEYFNSSWSRKVVFSYVGPLEIHERHTTANNQGGRAKDGTQSCDMNSTPIVDFTGSREALHKPQHSSL